MLNKIIKRIDRFFNHIDLPVGHCRECGEVVLKKNKIPLTKSIYECYKCGFPNHTDDLFVYYDENGNKTEHVSNLEGHLKRVNKLV